MGFDFKGKQKNKRRVHTLLFSITGVTRQVLVQLVELFQLSVVVQLAEFFQLGVELLVINHNEVIAGARHRTDPKRCTWFR